MSELTVQDIVKKLNSLSSFSIFPKGYADKVNDEAKLANLYLKQVYALVLIWKYIRLDGHNTYARLSIILEGISNHLCCTALISKKDLEPLVCNIPVYEMGRILNGLADKIMKQALKLTVEQVIKTKIQKMFFSTHFYSEN